MKQRTNDSRPQLPNVFANSAKSSTMARSSKSTQNKGSSTVGQNGNDATIDMTNDNIVDMSSPYSPGSTLSDGLFDPPSPANFNNSPVANAPLSTAAKTSTPKVNKSAEKKDAFDALFGILPPVKTATKNRNKKVAKEKTKKCTYFNFHLSKRYRKIRLSFVIIMCNNYYEQHNYELKNPFYELKDTFYELKDAFYKLKDHFYKLKDLLQTLSFFLIILLIIFQSN